MDDNNSDDPVPATLAEVIDRVSTTTKLCAKRRDEAVRALRRISKLQALPPAEIPADPTSLRAYLTKITPGSLDLSAASIRNLKSLLSSALAVTGVTKTRRRSDEPMSSAWSALLERLPDRYARSKLSRFARHCTAEGIEPCAVDDMILAAFGTRLERDSLVPRFRQVHRDTATTWNLGAKTIGAWPPRYLTVPSTSKVYSLPLSSFLQSFQDDVSRYFENLAEKKRGRRSASRMSEITLRDRRIQVIEIASALVHQGHPISSIKSLGDLATVPAAEAILTFFADRKGQDQNGHLHNLARRITEIAEYWHHVADDVLSELKEMRNAVNPGKREFAEKNKARLRPFADETNLERLVNLPHRIVNRIEKKPEFGYNDAVAVQTAVILAIAEFAPLRAGDIANLCISRNLVRSRPGEDALIHIVLKARKNKTDIELELSPEVAKLIDLYVMKYRPKLLKAESDFLFPNTAGGPKDPGPLGTQVKNMIQKEIGMVVNIHLLRSLGAFVYLRTFPGDYETVRQFLGHKSINTTIQYYCWLETSDAFRRLGRLLDKYRSNPENEHGK